MKSNVSATTFFYRGLFVCPECKSALRTKYAGGGSFLDFMVSPRPVSCHTTCTVCGEGAGHGRMWESMAPNGQVVQDVVELLRTHNRIHGVVSKVDVGRLTESMMSHDGPFVFRRSVRCRRCVEVKDALWRPVVAECAWYDAPVLFNPDLVPVPVSGSGLCACGRKVGRKGTGDVRESLARTMRVVFCVSTLYRMYGAEGR